MATVIKHHSVNIYVLGDGEEIASVCGPGDIAIVTDAAGWWIKFVGEDGHVDCYGEPYSSYSQAVGSAKAAAEIGT
jgi:hypothetical protein